MSTNTPVAFTFSPAFSVRVVTRDGDPWFVAKDIADALDYTWNATKTVGHIPEEWRGVESVPTPSGQQDVLVLSEPGLYFFLGRSDKPKALPFQKWFASEVLPAIRKTGSYTAQPVKPALPPKPQIKTRDDLSFTKRDAEGRLVNWVVKQLHDMRGDEYERGEKFFDEVSELAAHSETEAYNAVRFALSGREWPGDGKHWQRRDRPGSGWGAEDGFSEAIARAVIDGLRARKGGQESFDPKGGDKKRGRPALPKPKNSAMPSLPIPAQQALVLH